MRSEEPEMLKGGERNMGQRMEGDKGMKGTWERKK